jgi:hypothetical protein
MAFYGWMARDINRLAEVSGRGNEGRFRPPFSAKDPSARKALYLPPEDGFRTATNLPALRSHNAPLWAADSGFREALRSFRAHTCGQYRYNRPLGPFLFARARPGIL